MYISQCYFVSHYCDFTILHCVLISELYFISDNCDFNFNCDFIVILKCSSQCDVFFKSYFIFTSQLSALLFTLRWKWASVGIHFLMYELFICADVFCPL